VVEAGTVQRNHIKNGDGDCGIQQEVERAGVGGLWSDDVDDGAALRAQQRPSVAKEVTEKQTLQALQEEPRGQTAATSGGIVSRCESTATRKEWGHSICSAWEPPRV
jgi:hypothetical protein